MNKLQDKAMELVKKYGLTDEEIEKEKQEQIKIKTDYTRNNTMYEQNLLNYFNVTEDIMDENGKPLAQIRYPSYKDITDFVPKEIMSYVKNNKPIPEELQEKYSDNVFKMMENLIVSPKHDAEWWKSQPRITEFVKLFNDKYQEIVERVIGEAINFPIAPTGKQ